MKQKRRSNNLKVKAGIFGFPSAIHLSGIDLLTFQVKNHLIQEIDSQIQRDTLKIGYSQNFEKDRKDLRQFHQILNNYFEQNKIYLSSNIIMSALFNQQKDIIHHTSMSKFTPDADYDAKTPRKTATFFLGQPKTEKKSQLTSQVREIGESQQGNQLQGQKSEDGQSEEVKFLRKMLIRVSNKYLFFKQLEQQNKKLKIESRQMQVSKQQIDKRVAILHGQAQLKDKNKEYKKKLEKAKQLIRQISQSHKGLKGIDDLTNILYS